MKIGKRTYLMSAAALLLAVVATGAVWANRQSEKLSQPVMVTVPEGTAVDVVLTGALSSDRSRPGETFDATVAQPVVIDNETVIPKGAPVKGRVVDAVPAGHLRGVPRLKLALTELDMDGRSYPVATSYAVRSGRNHNKRNLAWIGGGGAGGAVIGAIAGGGKGALIGGPVGAGAGTLVAFLTGKHDIKLPAEQHLTFKLTQPISIDLKG
ncbi:MAG: hypothetical protein LAN37_15770 [Acidobacteriia bacterium]|nr:hypothetical protein [Terriglobia bacterium]